MFFCIQLPGIIGGMPGPPATIGACKCFKRKRIQLSQLRIFCVLAFYFFFNMWCVGQNT